MSDPSFPALHIRPARGWLNDPNGLCRIDGRYHVFFQHNPDSPVHGAICWGHVSSTDLLSWTEHPVALRPRPGELDAAGCWSGCVVDDGGVPTAVYTAVPDEPGNAVVALARSDRTLVSWVPSSEPGPARPADGSVEEVRDPFLFEFQGHRYAVQGAGSRSGPPQLLLYGCDDLRAWTPLGPLLDGDDPIAAAVAPAEIWECPNLVQVDGCWVLLVSLWRWVGGTHQLSGVRYLLGDLVLTGDGLRFRVESGGVLDEGPAFYAPQTLVEADRVLVWGWAWELDRSGEQVEAAGWAGVLTYPRELLVQERKDGSRALASRPARELTGLRSAVLTLEPGAGLREPSFEVVASGPVRLSLRHGDTVAVVTELAGTRAEPARLLVDGSLVEAFAAGRCWTTRAYPTSRSQWLVEGDRDALAVHRLSGSGGRH
ncbi:MAG: glycoside hydrolase family 32 protein [Friedmanniella sp.]